ncbi:MAG: NAD(P)H-binding protein [Chloroflexi bacterium]|nr:NAD(P)H-binding protein [Chloroflexota bacterium]
MRVLVTGAAGFAGEAAVAALVAAGHAVRASDVAPIHATSDVEVVPGALTDASVVAEAVRGVDAVLHLAGGHWADAVDLRTSLEASVVATMLLYQAAAAAGIGRAVLMSSGAVVAGHPRGTWIDRGTPPAFEGPYPLAKWLQEEVARRFAAGAGGPSLCAPILRPWVVVDATTRRLRTGVPIDAVTDPVAHDGCFGWIDRHDLADACVRALEVPLQGAPVFPLMANPIGRALVDPGPAEQELGWRPRHDFSASIPSGWRMPDTWPVPLVTGDPA